MTPMRLYIMVLQNRPTKLDFWYFFTFVCCNACSVGDFTKSSNFVNHFCVSRSYKNRPHFCSTKLAYKKTNGPFTTDVLQFLVLFLGTSGLHLLSHSQCGWVTCQNKAPLRRNRVFSTFLSQNFDLSVGSDFVTI